MKKLFFVATAIVACAMISVMSAVEASAQTSVPEVVNYYGVDFSKVRTFGAIETGSEFKKAFLKINSLVMGEWRKYDPGMRLGNAIDIQDIKVTQVLNEKIDPSKIAVTSSRYALTDSDIVEMVRRYEIAENEGTGLVIIGELLNKQTVTGSFAAVWFDIATREILSVRSLAGKAHGFGLRNYWAGALYSALTNK